MGERLAHEVADLPIDREWLTHIGGVERGGVVGFGLVEYSVDWHMVYMPSVCKLLAVKTRGDFLELCRLMSIDLRRL